MVKSTGLLCAFRHPLVLISIVLLLMNDHLFKAVMASELTGKLSDLAGLFFFPFLLGTILQGLARLAWPTRRFRSRQALAVSFIISLAVFSAIKTIPAANDLMAGLLSGLLHLPVRIVLDPTDLGALVVFIPAWMLWGRIEQGRRLAATGKLEVAILGLSALACVATAPCMPVSSIQRLVAINEILYARMEPDNPVGFLSRDLGNTWEAAQPIPADIFSDMMEPPALPLALCDPVDERICFRINGQPWVEGSQDGGSSWYIAWQIPPERESYLQRAENSGFMTCGKDPNITPQDMAFVTIHGSSTLVVAMGNEGVVIHPLSGGWQRTAVGPFMVPTPIAASNLDEAFKNIAMESILGLVGAALIYLGLSLWAWIFADQHASPTANRKPGYIFRPARLVVVWILLLVALPMLNGIIGYPLTQYINAVWLFTAVTLPLSILLISIVIWIRAGNLAARPGRYRLYGLVALVTGIGICAVFVGCLLLWALGVIAMYEIALVIAVLVSVLIFILVVMQMRRGLQMAPSEFDGGGS